MGSLRRIPRIARWALGGIAVVVLVVFYGANAVMVGNGGLDRCMTDAPASADVGSNVGIRYSPVPWRWTCVYEDIRGREIRHGMSVHPWPF